MYGNCYSYGAYPSQYPYSAPYKDSTFLLIVVLFILLIIVGRSLYDGR